MTVHKTYSRIKCQIYTHSNKNLRNYCIKFVCCYLLSLILIEVCTLSTSSSCSDYFQIHYKKILYIIMKFEHIKGPTLNLEVPQKSHLLYLLFISHNCPLTKAFLISR